MTDGRLGKALRYLRRSFVPSASEPSDRQLLARFAESRDQDAFTVLVRRHGPMVLAVCRRVLGEIADAEDAFQATFVVLARKAGASGWQESLGSWLYEVAYRCAAKARTASARRRSPVQVPDMPEKERACAVEHEELRAVLDDELSRLPEKYRAPLVLCYLEGKSSEEAAGLLGCPVGTVHGRLSRARDLLRARLAKRCLMIPVAAVLAEDVVQAAVPAKLLDATIQAAALSGELAAPVAVLVEGVLRAMHVTKLKMAALLLGVCLIGAGVGTYHWQTRQGNRVAAASFAPPPEAEVAAQPDDGKARSKAVRVDGLTFQAVVDKVWLAPTANKETVVDITLEITNGTNKQQTLRIWESPRVSVATPDGKELASGYARDATAPVKRLDVPAGKTVRVSRQAALSLTDNGFRLTGSDNSAGSWWYDNFKAAKYVVTLSYDSDVQNDGSWRGSATTEPVEITIKPAKEPAAK